jgi:hypothetical protein
MACDGNGMPFSLTLGCGTWGGNIASENITPESAEGEEPSRMQGAFAGKYLRVNLTEGADRETCTRAGEVGSMCHIGTPGHGRRFRAKLKRLARRGEKWAEAERAYYLRADLRVTAEDWAALRTIGRCLAAGMG